MHIPTRVMDRAKLSKGDIECGNLCTLDAVHSRLRQPTELRNAVPPHGLSSAPHALVLASAPRREVGPKVRVVPKIVDVPSTDPNPEAHVEEPGPTGTHRPVQAPSGGRHVDRTTFLVPTSC